MRKVCDGAEFWTCNSMAAKVFHLNYIESEPGGGLSKRPNTIRQGGNSGYQALALAIHFGAARVILLGYDMQFAKDGKRHWHPDHTGKLHNPMSTQMRAWPVQYAELAKATPVPIINASRATALKCFPRMTIEEALIDA